MDQPALEAEAIAIVHSVHCTNEQGGIAIVVNALATTAEKAKAQGYAEGLKDGYANCLKSLNLENPRTSEER